jgi:hypothetical protein
MPRLPRVPIVVVVHCDFTFRFVATAFLVCRLSSRSLLKFNVSPQAASQAYASAAACKFSARGRSRRPGEVPVGVVVCTERGGYHVGLQLSPESMRCVESATFRAKVGDDVRVHRQLQVR